MLSGSFSTFAPVASASRTTSVESAARKAAPRYLDRGPRRTITHGAPASVPRSWSSSAVRLTVVNPNACANRSEAARSGLLNSSQARSSTLMTGFFARPGCSPGSAPCSLCRSLWVPW